MQSFVFFAFSFRGDPMQRARLPMQAPLYGMHILTPAVSHASFFGDSDKPGKKICTVSEHVKRAIKAAACHTY